MKLTARDGSQVIASAGYVLAEGRYIDRAHGIDWAVILWDCATCGSERPSPGPGEPPYCCDQAMCARRLDRA